MSNKKVEAFNFESIHQEWLDTIIMWFTLYAKLQTNALH